MTDLMDKGRFVSHYPVHFARYGATLCGSPLGRFRFVVENERNVSCTRCRFAARSELARLRDRVDQVTKARDETVNDRVRRLLDAERIRLEDELERIEGQL